MNKKNNLTKALSKRIDDTFLSNNKKQFCIPDKIIGRSLRFDLMVEGREFLVLIFDEDRRVDGSTVF